MMTDHGLIRRLIAERLKEANSVLLFPHAQMDGDAFGSAVALARALRSLGKTAWILIAEDIPGNLQFLDDQLTTTDQTLLPRPDVSLAVDCSDASRIELREEAFLSAKTTIVIDHHLTFGDSAEINLIDPTAAATGELIYDLLSEMDVPIDRTVAEALYAAIATDTGNFQYSNTTARTHQIVAELYRSGMDHAKVAIAIYQSVRPEKIRLLGAALNEVVFSAGGQAALTIITQEMLERTGAAMSESEGIVETLRSIRGVEIAAVLKEDRGRVHVGLRSKSTADVAAVAVRFGGGGHRQASGYTSSSSLAETAAQLTAAIAESLGA